jgi:hypothetical protein
MRRRLRKFFPVVLIALAVQVLAPIAACWAAGVVASDPLQVGVICHNDGASPSRSADPAGQPSAHDGCCSVCSVAHGGAPLDTPQTAVATPYGAATRVVWLDFALYTARSRTGSHAQARAPPRMT